MPQNVSGDGQLVRPLPVPRPLVEVSSGGDWISEVPEVVVTGITLDSRRVAPGDIYCALPGATTHGAVFIAQAVAGGAVAVLTDEHGAALVRQEFADLPLLVAKDPRAEVGQLASAIYGHPSRDLKIVGITGTDGKTTTAMLTEAGLRSAGYSTGLIGTIATRIGDEQLRSVRTTPEAPDLHALLAVMRERGVGAVAMEVSSHALALGRVSGVEFDLAVFTNLGHDHLDFHKDQEDYFRVKARLFTPRYSTSALVCVDDEWGQQLADVASIPVQTYSVPAAGQASAMADWSATDLSIDEVGWRFSIQSPAGVQQTGCRLPGLFNVRNAVAAVASCVVLGASLDLASAGVAECAAVPGRMQPVAAAAGFAVLVDYAHTPDAVGRALDVGRELAEHRGGRLLVLLGCGGDRDRQKRPLMGELAARLADVVVITDDNPRSEDAAQIRREMMGGVELVPHAQRAEVHDIAGREVALRDVVRMAGSGDVVLALGKGHETTQEIDGEFHDLDDRVVLAAAISELSA